MELPVHDVVNTGLETFRNGDGASGFITIILKRETNSIPWGFRLQGGKDRGLPFQLLKVPLDSLASHSGCKTGDYLVKISGEDVFCLTHDEATQLVKKAGNTLNLVIERGDKIVPSMNDAFPKSKAEGEDSVDLSKPKPYYQQVLERTGQLPGQGGRGFTTVGKAKMACKQYNSPLGMYSEEVVDEIMQQGTAFGKDIDPSNPWNMSGNVFDASKSGVLSAIMEKEKK